MQPRAAQAQKIVPQGPWRRSDTSRRLGNGTRTKKDMGGSIAWLMRSAASNDQGFRRYERSGLSHPSLPCMQGLAAGMATVNCKPHIPINVHCLLHATRSGLIRGHMRSRVLKLLRCNKNACSVIKSSGHDTKCRRQANNITCTSQLLNKTRIAQPIVDGRNGK